MQLIKIFYDKTFLKFIIVGIINTAVGAGVMFALYNIFNCSYWISSIMNYVVGSVVSFFLNKYFTFKSRHFSFKEVIYFILNIAVCFFIAYGAAKSAYENGAKLVFTYMGEENKEKIESLISEFEGSKAYECDASKDEKIEETFKSIRSDFGKIDGILHSIAHANTEDLRNDFIYTSKEGFAHANDISAYSFIAVARIAKALGLLEENASIVSLTYYGSTKVLPGYNLMGVAKAALECSVRYLADNLGPEGIRVNAISAGPIKTLSAKGIKDFNSILDVVEEKAPLRRNVTIQEVGNSVAFLLSPISSAITGQVIFADSGYNIMGI